MIVSDNGTELTSNAILSRQQEHDVEWHYIAPGKPMQNGFVESFNGRKPRRGTPDHRRMEDRLQYQPTAHEPQRAHPHWVRSTPRSGAKLEQTLLMNEGKSGSRSVPLELQSVEDLLWIRDEFLKNTVDFGRIVVHGHTPTLRPEVLKNRINIDTGAFATGTSWAIVSRGAADQTGSDIKWSADRSRFVDAQRGQTKR
jgi:Integrase core domain